MAAYGAPPYVIPPQSQQMFAGAMSYGYGTAIPDGAYMPSPLQAPPEYFTGQYQMYQGGASVPFPSAGSFTAPAPITQPLPYGAGSFTASPPPQYGGNPYYAPAPTGMMTPPYPGAYGAYAPQSGSFTMPLPATGSYVPSTMGMGGSFADQRFPRFQFFPEPKTSSPSSAKKPSSLGIDTSKPTAKPPSSTDPAAKPPTTTPGPAPAPKRKPSSKKVKRCCGLC